MIRVAAMTWAALLQAGAQDSTTAEDLPSIRAVQGDLHIWSPAKDKLEPVKDSVRLTPADRVGTRKDHHGILATQDGSLISLSDVEVGHEKGIALERTRDKLVIKLYKGKIVLETFQTGIRVETPGGVIEGGRSYSVIQVDGGKTKVTAVEGTLTFTNLLGKVTLEGGRESSADRASKPSEPKAADVEKALGDLAQQAAALNMLKNPGFEEGLKDWGVDPVHGKEPTTLDTARSHSGRQCVRLEISDRIYGTERPSWLGFKQNVTLTPGKRYLIRAYLRQEIRAGTVTPYVSIATQSGPTWTADPSEKGWVRVGGVFTAESGWGGCRVSVEARVGSDRFDAVVWADDFYLVELK